MKNNLSAIYYIKNNAKRVLILVISLALFVFMLYGVSFVINITGDTEARTTDYFKKIQIVSPNYETFGIDSSHSEDPDVEKEKREQYNQGIEEMRRKVAGVQGVEQAFLGCRFIGNMKAPIGNVNVEMISTDIGNLALANEYMGAKLVYGRMPEQPDEMLIDRMFMNNIDADIGSVFTNGGKVIGKVVGIVESGYYYSIALKGDMANNTVYILSDNGMNLTKTMNELGYDVFNVCADFESVYNSKKADYASLESNSLLVTCVASIVLAICLSIVFAMYIRDRREEWCLYNSLGFNAKSIYLMVLKELALIFVSGIIIGALLCLIFIPLLNAILVVNNGLVANMFKISSIFEMLVVCIFVFSICQIPIYLNLRKIRTVDEIKEDVF